MIATVTSKGQVTLPGPLRAKLGIKAGSKLDFFLRPDGHLEVEVINGTLDDLIGILPPPFRKLTLEEMDAALTGESSDK